MKGLTEEVSPQSCEAALESKSLVSDPTESSTCQKNEPVDNETSLARMCLAFQKKAKYQTSGM